MKGKYLLGRKVRRRHRSSKRQRFLFCKFSLSTLFSPVNRRSIHSLPPSWTPAIPSPPRWTGYRSGLCLYRSTATRKNRFQWNRRKTRERSLGSAPSHFTFQLLFCWSALFFFPNHATAFCFLFRFVFLFFCNFTSLLV